MLSLEEAMALLRKGARFVDVEELVREEDAEELRYRFCREPGLPNLAARSAVAAGFACERCGGETAWRGTCRVCTVCGDGGTCG